MNELSLLLKEYYPGKETLYTRFGDVYDYPHLASVAFPEEWSMPATAATYDPVMSRISVGPKVFSGMGRELLFGATPTHLRDILLHEGAHHIHEDLPLWKKEEMGSEMRRGWQFPEYKFLREQYFPRILRFMELTPNAMQFLADEYMAHMAHERLKPSTPYWEKELLRLQDLMR